MTADRRRAPRTIVPAGEALSRVRLRTGRELAVIDVSAAGTLVEGDTRLLPGTRVDVHVMTPRGRFLVRSRVLRAQVAVLSADRVVYRAALAFDAPIDLDSGYQLPRAPQTSAGVAGTHYPPDPA